MSCVIYLVRHGIAGPASATVTDANRSLTADGTRKMARVAAGLKRLGVAPDAVLSSPLRRAEETAAVLARVLAPQRDVEIYPPLAPGHEPANVLNGLTAHRRANSLMLVGHQPALGELASYLITASSELAALPLKKGGVAAVRVAAVPPRAAGTLEWFLTPKQLRAIGRRGC
jgi:phosphohistidine phosphatase